MILTEEEAKGRRCPINNVHNCLFCIASGCMAWRWLEGYLPFNNEEQPIKKGYCGLAGEP
ncbi:MAG: hypothetical protein ABIF11_00285 [Nitrospirota bacterium]